ncbi:hypothetical protein [Polaromonas sp. OV174]|uniref:hypothetical protein n=1 Tax=Polaromonas sp. OV174 TaxID=1855300 RepID=UPI0015A6C485|nr:hypothetical protein [Polaromonas sp. OV174]
MSLIDEIARTLSVCMGESLNFAAPNRPVVAVSYWPMAGAGAIEIAAALLTKACSLE